MFLSVISGRRPYLIVDCQPIKVDSCSCCLAGLSDFLAFLSEMAVLVAYLAP